MADQIETGLEWLATQNRTYRARTVTYVRGGESVSLSATVGRTVMRVDTGYGVYQRHEVRDYICDVSDLGDLAPPQAGDQVKDTISGTVNLFEVMAPGNEPEWKYSDPYHNTVRVHTKLTGTE